MRIPRARAHGRRPLLQGGGTNARSADGHVLAQQRGVGVGFFTSAMSGRSSSSTGVMEPSEADPPAGRAADHIRARGEMLM